MSCLQQPSNLTKFLALQELKNGYEHNLTELTLATFKLSNPVQYYKWKVRRNYAYKEIVAKH